MNYARQYPRFWLAYFVLTVVMLVINTVSEAFANFGSTAASSLVGTVLAVAGLRPLYGYVRQRRYDPRWLWKIVLAASGMGTLVIVLICLFVAVSKLSIIPVLVMIVIMSFGGPYLLALHQYVYRSPHLWVRDLTQKLDNE
ncbi:MAG TPA: hypothetical protein PKH72_15000 [Rhodoferax sp.]|nr:hypothetical protein [Rhodoferax sp.]HPW31167.1 hypothetical protein [Rhodoferax sp.]